MKKALIVSSALFLSVATSAWAQSDSAFAVSKAGVNLLRLNTDASFVVRGTEGTGLLPATGAGVRMMWFPNLYAFRAGKLEAFAATYWDLASIGEGSAAFGQNTRASGPYSFAANLETTASGNESAAFGSGGIASGDKAFAFNGTAAGTGSVAIGIRAQATNDGALAMGGSSTAGGRSAIVLGSSTANGDFAVAIGVQNSASGQSSVAIGKNARTANRQGSIVFGDGCAGFPSDSVYPTADNQFVARGCGGIKMYTSQDLSTGVEVAAGGGSWSSVSDRNAKENFKALDGEEILKRLRSVPVSSWNYKTQPSEIRHIGPMAQDFFAAFKVGESERLINSLDIDGVNLAGVRALEVRTAKQQDQIRKLEKSNAELLKRLEKLEAKLK